MHNSWQFGASEIQERILTIILFTVTEESHDLNKTVFLYKKVHKLNE